MKQKSLADRQAPVGLLRTGPPKKTQTSWVMRLLNKQRRLEANRKSLHEVVPRDVLEILLFNILSLPTPTF